MKLWQGTEFATHMAWRKKIKYGQKIFRITEAGFMITPHRINVQYAVK